MSKPIIKTLLTEDEANETWCPLRIAFISGFITIIALQLYVVIILVQAFDPISLGAALGSLIGGTGGGLWASSKQETS